MTKNINREKALKNHIQRVEKRLQKLEKDKLRFSKYRLVVFILGIALIYWLGWIPFIFAVFLLSTESIYHKYYGKIIKKHLVWINIKKTQMARMKLDWDNIPKSNFKSQDPNHPFESDLNITGNKSLHHLIDFSISHEGSLRLKNWFLQTSPNIERIEERQKIIKELVPLARFRDKLLLNFLLVSKEQMDGKKLLDWLQTKHDLSFLPRLLSISFGLALVNIILFTIYSLGWISSFWIFSLTLYVGLYFFLEFRIG